MFGPPYEYKKEFSRILSKPIHLIFQSRHFEARLDDSKRFEISDLCYTGLDVNIGLLVASVMWLFNGETILKTIFDPYMAFVQNVVKNELP